MGEQELELHRLLGELKLIEQGAEARLYEGMFMGKRAIVKQRFSKSYRIPELDRRLTKERMREEARTLARLIKTRLVDVPCVYHVHVPSCSIVMERIDGITLKQLIYQQFHQKQQDNNEWHDWIAEQVGKSLAQIHDSNVIHGDLTTSNIMIRNFSSDQLDRTEISACFIDFGLSQSSSLSEDRAVDLYVLERAFQSTHPEHGKLFDDIIHHYFLHKSKSSDVARKLEEVRMRGRKRDMVG